MLTTCVKFIDSLPVRLEVAAVSAQLADAAAAWTYTPRAATAVFAAALVFALVFGGVFLDPVAPVTESARACSYHSVSTDMHTARPPAVPFLTPPVKCLIHCRW